MSNMSNITESIKVYLNEVESDYAVLIDGSWGCGKTYFIKNELIPELENDLNTKRDFIYISLFGLKNIDDIYSAISMSIIEIKSDEHARRRAEQQGYKASSKSNLNIGNVTGLKSIFRKGLDFIPGGKQIEYIANDITRNIISFDKYVFIFDDFERASISKTELLGFFDVLADQHHAKTIVVCNEEKIENNLLESNTSDDNNGEQGKEQDSVNKNVLDDEDTLYYKKYKEKVFGMQIKFSRDFSVVYDKLVEKFAAGSDCQQYLMHDKELVLERFSVVGVTNLRTLVFAIKRFRELYEAVKNVFEVKDDGVDYFNIFVPSLLNNVIVSSIACRDLGQKNYYGDSLENIMVWNNKGLDGSMFKIGDYFFTYRFVDEYLYNYTLDVKLIEKQYFNLIATENDVNKISNEIYSILKMKELEARIKFNSVMDYIKDDVYSINVYPYIISEIFSLDEVLNNGCNLDRIKNNIRQNAQNNVESFCEDNWRLFGCYHKDAKKFINEICDYLYERNKQIKKSEEIAFFSRTEGFIKNFESIIRDDIYYDSIKKSNFEYISPKEFTDILFRIDSGSIIEIQGILRRSYINVSNIRDHHSGEYDFFRESCEILNQKLQSENIEKDKLELYHLRNLCDMLGRVRDKLK